MIVDGLSGYCDVEPYSKGTVEHISELTRTILKRMGQKMKLRGGKCFSDAGTEFLGPKGQRSNLFTDVVTGFGMRYSALPTAHIATYVEEKNGDIRRNINSILAKKGSKKWTEIYRQVVNGLNSSSFTDFRAPRSPNDILKLSAKEQRKLFFEHKKHKSKRNAKEPGARLAPIPVGSFVRLALKPKMKGAKIERKGPKPRWSGKSYKVLKMSKRNMYTVEGLPKRRFNRYMLQPIPGKRDVDTEQFKDRGTRTFTDARAYPHAGEPGSKENPFKDKSAARKAGFRKSDPVYWIYKKRIRARL